MDPDDLPQGPDQDTDDRVHAALPVEGYNPQSEANVKLVNFHKQWEERCLRHLDWLARQDGVDQRWLAIGRTGVEKSFMAINRSIFQPGRIALPEDMDGSTVPSNQRPFRPDDEDDKPAPKAKAKATKRGK